MQCALNILLETIHKYSRLVERLGFDENFVDVTELVKTYPWSEKFNQPLPEFVLSHPTEGIKMTRIMPIHFANFASSTPKQCSPLLKIFEVKKNLTVTRL